MPRKYMRHGKRYEIKKSILSALIDSERDMKRFCYAEPVEYADGSMLGDCWIVDKNGRRYPGLNISPVPICVDSLGKVVAEW